ncbi:hypothetical protein GCM10010872_04660 [Dyella flava]|nr:hypothetical protein GCM10010872_04660 [Dyella flava]
MRHIDLQVMCRGNDHTDPGALPNGLKHEPFGELVEQFARDQQTSTRHGRKWPLIRLYVQPVVDRLTIGITVCEQAIDDSVCLEDAGDEVVNVWWRWLARVQRIGRNAVQMGT